MKKDRKKKIALGCLVLLQVIWLVVVLGIGGEVAPWFWIGEVFVLAPIATLALLPQIIVVIIRIFQRKSVRFNALFLLVSLVLAYPVTILFGKSILTYPSCNSNVQSLKVQRPVKDAIYRGGKNFKSHAVWPSDKNKIKIVNCLIAFIIYSEYY